VTDVSFVDLRRDFAAVIIACGAKRSRALPIPNADAIGVMGGVDFLRDVSMGKEVSLGQRIALENTYFYEVLGLKSDPSRAVPDYLVTQLEFLAALRYTCEHTSEESSAVSLARAETEFLERHLLNWLPAAKAKLDRTNAPGFPMLMTMLVQFLRHMHKSG